MLAHSALALITEKLQNQRLEESCPTATSRKLPVGQGSSARLQYLQQSDLAVKGKNVWALSVESGRHGQHESGQQQTSKASPQSPKQTQVSQVALCPHKKLQQSCQLCDSSPGTPMAPPKKKHCRSLSVPPDSLTVLPAPIRTTGSKLWKPVAVIPHSYSNFQSSQKTSQRPEVQLEGSAEWLTKFSSGFKLVPAAPSSPSADSGHCTSSDIQTPSVSPIPRPLSASSDTSFSSRGSGWQYCSPLRTRVKVLENRSLSCEDRISGSFSTSSMACTAGNTEQSYRCHSSNSQDASNISGSQDASNSGGGSSSSSSSSDIPRCHSQPCVLHHRRFGKKRRRDCDRPTLNFIKMTETAYSLRPGVWSIGSSDLQHNKAKPQVLSEHLITSGFGLIPIASSPVDTELPLLPHHILDSDLDHAASVALPLTPPNCDPFMACRSREDKDEEADCNCHDSRTSNSVRLFPMSDLDLEQIENH